MEAARRRRLEKKKHGVYFDNVQSGNKEMLQNVQRVELYTTPIQLIQPLDVSEARVCVVADVLMRYLRQQGHSVDLVRPLRRPMIPEGEEETGYFLDAHKDDLSDILCLAPSRELVLDPVQRIPRMVDSCAVYLCWENEEYLPMKFRVVGATNSDERDDVLAISNLKWNMSYHPLSLRWFLLDISDPDSPTSEVLGQINLASEHVLKIYEALEESEEWLSKSEVLKGKDAFDAGGLPEKALTYLCSKAEMAKLETPFHTGLWKFSRAIHRACKAIRMCITQFKSKDMKNAGTFLKLVKEVKAGLEVIGMYRDDKDTVVDELHEKDNERLYIQRYEKEMEQRRKEVEGRCKLEDEAEAKRYEDACIPRPPENIRSPPRPLSYRPPLPSPPYHPTTRPLSPDSPPGSPEPRFGAFTDTWRCKRR